MKSTIICVYMGFGIEYRRIEKTNMNYIIITFLLQTLQVTLMEMFHIHALQSQVLLRDFLKSRYSQVAKRIGHPHCIKRPKHCIFETFVWVWVG